MEKVNIAEILKKCPKGMELYSPIFGELKFIEVNAINNNILVVQQNGYITEFESDGRLINCKNGECLLFPSKDQRDWSKFEVAKPKFDISTLKPFESRVLMRSSNAREWVGTFYSHYSDNKFYGCGMCCDQCIPYERNEHLLGKTDDCDEYFKNW